MLKRAKKHVAAPRTAWQVQGATGRGGRGGGSLALAWDLTRGRWGSLVGTFLALGLAVGILSMTGLVFASAQPQVPARYAGAAVLVKTPSTGGEVNGLFYPDKPWSPEQARSLAERLGRIPQVAAAVPDRVFYAQVVIGGKPVAGDIQGYLWPSAALAPYRLAAGRPPAGPGEVVVSRALGLAPGRQVTVLTADGPASYSVSGTVAGPGYYFAQARTGGVRVIGLVAEAGADVAAIKRAARAVVGAKGLVLSGEARSATEPVADVQTRWFGYQILSGMAILVAFTAVFIVASTFAFGVAQRRRELGLLRTVGATPRQMRALMHGEALWSAWPPPRSESLSVRRALPASARPSSIWDSNRGVLPWRSGCGRCSHASPPGWRWPSSAYGRLRAGPRRWRRWRRCARPQWTNAR
ncbi:ABC transporter permease [Nonomuraea sp. NPDC049400]|uniref:ABC transporter permease n=1 Tax=Nonomuraea sp. NPDC049400 TaxID=3364352 RepID=UPI0037B7BC86